MVFGVAGACRKDELKNVKLQDLENHGELLLVKIPDTKTSKSRSFTISGEFYKIVKKYQDLRPPKFTSERFFINYRNGKCTVQVVGKNKFSTMPREIATYLNLPNIELYTGHSFRRTSATVLADSGDNLTTLKRHGGWKSSTVAEGYIEESIENKSKIESAISCAINLGLSTSSDSNDSSIVEPPTKKQKIGNNLDTKPLHDIKANNSERMEITPMSTKNIENPKLFHFENCNL